MKREKSPISHFLAWARASEWLVVVLPFTKRENMTGEAGLGATPIACCGA